MIHHTGCLNVRDVKQFNLMKFRSYRRINFDIFFYFFLFMRSLVVSLLRYENKHTHALMRLSDMSPVLQHRPSVVMGSEGDVLMKEYLKMMTDMIVLCATLALSLFFWVLSLTISSYSGELHNLFSQNLKKCWHQFFNLSPRVPTDTWPHRCMKLLGFFFFRESESNQIMCSAGDTGLSCLWLTSINVTFDPYFAENKNNNQQLRLRNEPDWPAAFCFMERRLREMSNIWI